MSGAHHPKYSMSNAHRFMMCAGQPAYCAGASEIETQHQKDGTFAHLALHFAILNKITDAGYLVGTWSHEGRWLDRDTADAIQYALDYVQGLRAKYPDLLVHSEWSLYFPQIVVPEQDCGGTIDIWCYSASAARVWVVDYKHGAGDRVDIDDNKQVQGYLCCVMGDVRQVHAATWTGVIIQPRHWAYTCAREKIFSAVDLMDFVQDMHAALRACQLAAHECSTGTLSLNPGTWCNRCPRHAECPAVERKVLPAIPDTVIAGAFDLAPEPPVDTGRLAAIIELAPDARAWFRACEERARALALQGQHVPGHKIVPGETRRRYRPDLPPAIIVQEAAKILPREPTPAEVFEFMPRRLLPLTELEKKLIALARAAAPPGLEDDHAKVVRQKFAFLTLKDAGESFHLVPETDPRPAYVRSASNDFAGVAPTPNFGVK